MRNLGTLEKCRSVCCNPGAGADGSAGKGFLASEGLRICSATLLTVQDSSASRVLECWNPPKPRTETGRLQVPGSVTFSSQAALKTDIRDHSPFSFSGCMVALATCGLLQSFPRHKKDAYSRYLGDEMA